MPKIRVVFFKDGRGVTPVIEWLAGLTEKAQTKCLVKIARLEELGHDLRRPEADTLRDGIHELRVALNHVQYRVLYFFANELAVLSHGLTKESDVPDKEINQAITNRTLFTQNPDKHTYTEDTEDKTNE